MAESALQRNKLIMLRDHLQARDIVDRRVIDAMARVPREQFVSKALEAEAYCDGALPIGCGQTISQPYIVALMTQALELLGAEHVLEIGTGSGYQTAVLAELARDVVSIERHEVFSQQAAARLAGLGYTRVRLVVGDGTLGWPEDAPYDRILVAAGAAEAPHSLIEQLAPGGILVIPLGGHEHQTLQAIHKVGEEPRVETLSTCRFVPLIGQEGWPDEP
jgi:protein-L-isoaspartate(D-aspartate) O-methyltransferase